MAEPAFTSLPALLSVLRLAAGDRDELRLTAAVTVANRKVRQATGRTFDDVYFTDPDVLADLGIAATTVAHNLYKLPAAAFGVVNAGGDYPSRIGPDPMKGVSHLIGAHTLATSTASQFGV